MGSHVWWLGIIQGLTEFLPVSSSGHLIILKTWMGEHSLGLMLESWLHGGTLLAIVVAYRRQFKEMMAGLWQGQRVQQREVAMIVAATLPAVVAGFLLSGWVDQLALPVVVALGWMATTLVVWSTPMAASRPVSHEIADLTLWQALAVGVAQAVALWPGFSRSAATILVGRRMGLTPTAAARLSFWMAIPTVTGAIVLTLAQDPGGLGRISGAWLMGLLGAFASGLFAIQWIRKLLASAKGYPRFGYYTLLAALAVILTQWLGLG